MADAKELGDAGLHGCAGDFTSSVPPWRPLRSCGLDPAPPRGRHRGPRAPLQLCASRGSSLARRAPGADPFGIPLEGFEPCPAHENDADLPSGNAARRGVPRDPRRGLLQRRFVVPLRGYRRVAARRVVRPLDADPSRRRRRPERRRRDPDDVAGCRSDRGIARRRAERERRAGRSRIGRGGRARRGMGGAAGALPYMVGIKTNGVPTGPAKVEGWLGRPIDVAGTTITDDELHRLGQLPTRRRPARIRCSSARSRSSASSARATTSTTWRWPRQRRVRLDVRGDGRGARRRGPTRCSRCASAGSSTATGTRGRTASARTRRTRTSSPPSSARRRSSEEAQPARPHPVEHRLGAARPHAVLARRVRREHEPRRGRRRLDGLLPGQHFPIQQRRQAVDVGDGAERACTHRPRLDGGVRPAERRQDRARPSTARDRRRAAAKGSGAGPGRRHLDGRVDRVDERPARRASSCGPTGATTRRPTTSSPPARTPTEQAAWSAAWKGTHFGGAWWTGTAPP